MPAARLAYHHTFIVCRDSDSCLFDLETDAFETRNVFSTPASRESVRQLARELVEYSARCREPDADQPSARADLKWAAAGTTAYVSPPRDVRRAGTQKAGDEDGNE